MLIRGVVSSPVRGVVGSGFGPVGENLWRFSNGNFVLRADGGYWLRT